MSSYVHGIACLAALAAGLAARADATDAMPGVLLRWVAAPGQQESWSSQLRDRLGQPSVAVLQRVYGGQATVGDGAPADTALLLNLRELPAALAAVPGGVGAVSYVICGQVRRSGESTSVIELAVCDVARGLLLSYKAAEAPLDQAEARFLALLEQIACGSLPGARRPEPPAPATGPPGSELAATALPSGLLPGLALESLVLSSPGEPAGPTRVLCRQTQLMANRDGDTTQQPLEVSVWRAGEDTHVDIGFAEPLASYTIPRRGAWAAVDLESVQVAGEHRIEVGRSGLVGIAVKPLGDRKATRIGFELTDAAEVRISMAPDQKRLQVIAGKQVLPEDERVEGSPNPYPGGYQVVKRFSGMASWYGSRLSGRRTASGERFNPSAWTAAHRTLPMGTWLRITNPANGRSGFVRVNDRGPFSSGRVLDVSSAAATGLGFYSRGVARLDAAVLRRAD